MAIENFERVTGFRALKDFHRSVGHDALESRAALAENFGINDDAFSALHNRSHFIADAADDGNFFTIERAVAVEAELPFRRKFITEVHDHCVRFFSIPHGVAHDFAAIKNHFHLLNISNFTVSSAQFIFSYEKADVFRAPASNLI